MKPTLDRDTLTLETLAAVIAHSQIVVAQIVVAKSRKRRSRQLPAGFDETDVAVLDWIVAEGRRRRFIVRM